MRSAIFLTLTAAALTLVACGSEGTNTSASGSTSSGAGGGAAQVQPLSVSGTAVDFENAAALKDAATISTSGLSPAPTISVTGADFSIKGVAPFSVFHILAGSPPNYRSTYNTATEVKDVDVTGVKAQVVAEAYLAKLATGFNTMSTPNTGIIIARALDGTGKALAGVPAAAFTVNDVTPPKTARFLDATMNPAPALAATSASGYVVFYDVPIGLVKLGSAMGSGYTIVAASAPTAATAVTLASLTVTPGDPVLPKNVSFTGGVIPIFTKRGCSVCHSGNSPGADLGNLSLNTGANSIYKELTMEVSQNFKTTRVNLMTPESSLIVTMPSFESPADPHPNVTFASTADPDYLTLLAWIKEGAKQN